MTAIDGSGQCDPVFSLSKNMLRFRAGGLLGAGPRLTLFNPYFSYSYPITGYAANPTLVPYPAQAGRLETIQWVATPTIGLEIDAYRWVLDPVDLADDTPRSGPGDFGHWSDWGPITQANLGPFPASDIGSIHRLYVEARDETGGRSNGGLLLSVVAAPAAP